MTGACGATTSSGKRCSRDGSPSDVAGLWLPSFVLLCTQHQNGAYAELDRRDRLSRAHVAALTEHKERTRDASSVVYFVRRGDLIKIGTTHKLAARLRALHRGDCAAPGSTVGPVELLATAPGGRRLERTLHDSFHGYRVPGTEWFKVNPRLLRLVQRYTRRAVAT